MLNTMEATIVSPIVKNQPMLKSEAPPEKNPANGIPVCS